MIDWTPPVPLTDDTRDVWDLLEAPAWHQQAACRGMDTNLFFPERGDDQRQAKAVCAACPVSTECLDDAMRAGDMFGIRGGLSERTRRRLRKQFNEEKARLAPKVGPRASCGTDSGYQKHRYFKEESCPACRAAHAAANAWRESPELQRAKAAARTRSRREAGWCGYCAHGNHGRCSGVCACPVAHQPVEEAS